MPELPDIKMVARTPAAKDAARDANITDDGGVLRGTELRGTYSLYSSEEDADDSNILEGSSQSFSQTT